jgi:hypothetical protein
MEGTRKNGLGDPDSCRDGPRAENHQVKEAIKGLRWLLYTGG